MERIELQRNRDFGDILSDTFGIVKQNFLPLLKCYAAICGVFFLANLGMALIANAQRTAMEPATYILSPYYWAHLLFSFSSYLAMIVTVVSYLAVYKEKGNQPAQVAEVWGYFKYYFFRVFVMLLMTVIISMVGALFCILPGIYFSVVFSLIAPVMIIENGSIDYTFRRVFQIIKGNWWSTFGVILLISILVGIAVAIIVVPAILVGGAGAFFTGKDMNTTSAIISAVFNSVGHLFYVIPTIAIVLVYFDLTEEKESNSLAGRIKMFGQSPSGDAPGQSTEQY